MVSLPRNKLVVSVCKRLTVESNAEFDLEVQSLIFPENKATDRNKFDNCEKIRALELNCCRNNFTSKLFFRVLKHFSVFKTQQTTVGHYLFLYHIPI